MKIHHKFSCLRIYRILILLRIRDPVALIPRDSGLTQSRGIRDSGTGLDGLSRGVQTRPPYAHLWLRAENCI